MPYPTEPPALVKALRDHDLSQAAHRHRPSPWHFLLLPLSLVMLTPLVWMVVTAVSTPEESRQFPPALPTSIQWSNFADVWAGSPFGHWLVNTAIVSGVVLISNLVLCSTAGYAFARLRFRGSGLAFMLLLTTLMVPFQVVLIPTLLIVKSFGLIDHLGTMSAPRWSISPNDFTMSSVGMRTTWNGTISVVSSSMKASPEPRKRSRANAYPAVLHRTRLEIRTTPDTMAVLTSQ